ncbi:protein Luc7p [[Candida] railenensis]|uniref:Protein Luc7p n=1 Tax=[Candida] railenensis TaxID=45579 RepID=A0A9P0QPU5_9ASCO|nr:protein Luc7p [[Candida] railenensis]
MAEYQRRLLEQLMGKDALISPAVRRRETLMSDHRVCKSFLVGTCPHDLFIGTKQDIGKCPLLHLEKHKLEYEYLTKKKGQQFPEFEYDYYVNLQRYIKDIDRTIETALKRLEHTPEEKAKIAAVTKELDSLDIQIGLMTQEIDCLVEVNQNLKSLYESVKLNELCKKREELAEQARNLVENVGQSAQQKLQVCEQCGAYLSRLDSDRRLADHFIGKIHLGYVQMRSAYEELHSKFKSYS